MEKCTENACVDRQLLTVQTFSNRSTLGWTRLWAEPKPSAQPTLSFLLCFPVKTIIQNLNTVFDKTATANFVKSEFNIQLKGGSGEDECKVAAAIMFCFKRGCWNLGEHRDPFTASRHQRPV